MANLDAVSLSTCVFSSSARDRDSIGKGMETAAEAGYRYVEVARPLADGLADEVAAVKKAGLQVWAVHALRHRGEC